jgi:hypothetical protein
MIRPSRGHQLEELLSVAIGIALVALLGVTSVAHAVVHRVPEAYRTIQDAVDASSTGDTVLLSPGTYRGVGNRDIQFHGRDIVVTSEAGAEATVIDCEWSARGFCLWEHETRAARIEGLTITNGEAPHIVMGGCGGGILCSDASPTIADCRVMSNDARQLGGGLMLDYSSASVQRCTFSNNYSAYYGGGVVVDGSPGAEIAGCLMIGNFSEYGAGAAFLGPWSFQLRDCTIVANLGTVGGGVCTGNPLLLERCIIRGNCAFIQGNELYGGVFNLRCCAIDSSGVDGAQQVNYDANCVFTDPLFCAPEQCGWFSGGDWTLNANSPCLPEHSPCSELIGALGQGCPAPSTGACCLPDGTCRVMEAWACNGAGGRFMGDGSSCEPNPCEPTPTERTTWGRIKARFR